MKNSTKTKFNYEGKKWGVVPLTNKYTNFQGLDIEFLIRAINRFHPDRNWRVVDLGSGGGNIDANLQTIYPKWSITGIDISQTIIKIAKHNFPQIKFLKRSAERIPAKLQSLDLIYAFDSLEHFENIESVLESTYRHLKNGGIFYAAIPLERQFPTIYWILYLLGWKEKRKKSGHINYFDAKSFTKLAEKYGFRLIESRYSFHFFFSLCDVAFYIMQRLLGKSIAFETEVFRMERNYKKVALGTLKNIISTVGFIESSMFWWLPGGKGHFLFIKDIENDFFSTHPPLTVAENYQQKYGLKIAMQPRDIEVNKLLEKLKYKDAKKLLDFGCANGIWLERLLSGTNVKGLGVDVSEELIDIANGRRKRRGEYICTKQRWPLNTKSVDFCISFDTFEHIKDKTSELDRLSKTLKKGGRILFYTLNPNNKYTIDWFFEELGSDYMYRRADHNKNLFIAPYDFTKLLKKTGFAKIDFELYDGPLNLVWRVISYSYLKIMEKVLLNLHVESLMKIVIYSNGWLLKCIVPVNNFIDGFFLRRGYSNGYFLWAEKR